jgi:hypothetical protein
MRERLASAHAEGPADLFPEQLGAGSMEDESIDPAPRGIVPAWEQGNMARHMRGNTDPVLDEALAYICVAINGRTPPALFPLPSQACHGAGPGFPSHEREQARVNRSIESGSQSERPSPTRYRPLRPDLSASSRQRSVNSRESGSARGR